MIKERRLHSRSPESNMASTQLRKRSPKSSESGVVTTSERLMRIRWHSWWNHWLKWGMTLENRKIVTSKRRLYRRISSLCLVSTAKARSLKVQQANMTSTIFKLSNSHLIIHWLTSCNQAQDFKAATLKHWDRLQLKTLRTWVMLQCIETTKAQGNPWKGLSANIAVNPKIHSAMEVLQRTNSEYK